MQKPHDYLRLWAAKHRGIYQDILYELEGGGDEAICVSCDRAAYWQCIDCVGRPSYCAQLLRLAVE